MRFTKIQAAGSAFAVLALGVINPAFAQSSGSTPAPTPSSGTDAPVKIEELVTVEGTLPRDGYRVESTTLGRYNATITIDSSRFDQRVRPPID